jgi:hypothetical protein
MDLPSVPSYYARTMTRVAQEWDWPPPRGRRYYRTVDIYQPSGRFRPRLDDFVHRGWNSPGVKKAIDVYWRVTITIIKMLIAVPLSLMAIGAIWFIWVLLGLLISKA